MYVRLILQYLSLWGLLVFNGLQAQVAVMEPDLGNYSYFAPSHFAKITVQKKPYLMSYMDLKPLKPNGKVIMLLHGKNFNGNYWRQTADTLLKRGFRVVIPDQIGFGKSSKPLHFQYSFQQLSILTKNLLDTLGIEKTAVLGHSMGGMLAIRFSLMFPQSVTHLILENPIGLEDYKLKVPYQPLDELYKKELKQTYESLKKYQLDSYYDQKWKKEYEEWLLPIAGWTLHEEYPIIAWNNALTTDMIMTQPVVYELSQIKVPTLLLIGQRDRTALGKDQVSKEVKGTMGNYPLLGEQAHAQISNSMLVKIADTGHLPHIESFESFIKPLLKFLTP